MGRALSRRTGAVSVGPTGAGSARRMNAGALAESHRLTGFGKVVACSSRVARSTKELAVTIDVVHA